MAEFFVKKQQQRRGFTIIELLVASVILALLATVGVTSYARVNVRSRDAKRKSDIEQLRAALEMYRADNSAYPNTGVSAVTLSTLDSYLVPTYMPSLPVEPRSGSSDAYRYQAMTIVTGNAYGYCLTTYLEGDTPPSTQPCTPTSYSPGYTGQAFGYKSP